MATSRICEDGGYGAACVSPDRVLERQSYQPPFWDVQARYFRIVSRSSRCVQIFMHPPDEEEATRRNGPPHRPAIKQPSPGQRMYSNGGAQDAQMPSGNTNRATFAGGDNDGNSGTTSRGPGPSSNGATGGQPSAPPSLPTSNVKMLMSLPSQQQQDHGEGTSGTSNPAMAMTTPSES